MCWGCPSLRTQPKMGKLRLGERESLPHFAHIQTPSSLLRTKTQPEACSVNLIKSLPLWLQTLTWLPSTLGMKSTHLMAHEAPPGACDPSALRTPYSPLVWTTQPPYRSSCTQPISTSGPLHTLCPLPRVLFVSYYPHLTPLERCKERRSCAQKHTAHQ